MQDVIGFEEFDQRIPLEQMMQEFSRLNYSAEFLADLEQGLRTSSIYAEGRNINSLRSGL